MPGRKVPLLTGEIYHAFNRGIAHCPTFTDDQEYLHALETVSYYRYSNPPFSFSRFFRLEAKKRHDLLNGLSGSKTAVSIICLCFMPNHYHLLLKQLSDNGISKFMANIQNSYTKYFNSKNSRDGSLFLNQFKAVRIETTPQLIHVSRYIHLNPYTGGVVNSHKQLQEYKWSSFPSYISDANDFLDKKDILENFPNQEYRSFVLDQADYQRKLKRLQSLVFE